MAGLSFLDLLFAEAMAAGLARHAQFAGRAERPAPDNFFVLPKDPRAWRQIRDSCKEEYMVIAVEITDTINANCKQVQPLFVDLAREFDSIPFLRVEVGPGQMYEELRRDLGGIDFTPTILIAFYHTGGVARAKFEGVLEIKEGIVKGHVQGVIRELLQRRVRLKRAQQLAEVLFTGVRNEREREIRESYEERLHKQFADLKMEREEQQQEEEEVRRREEEQRRKAAEKRRENRGEYVDELLKMDLDRAPIRDVKGIMGKLGISPHDCFERGDLKKKLIDNVPELRIRMELRAEHLKEEKSKMEEELHELQQKLDQKEKAVHNLNQDLQKINF